MIDVTTTAIVVAATSGFGFLSLLARLVFLWKVYKRGGRYDLTAAARALREARPRRLPLPTVQKPAVRNHRSLAPEAAAGSPPDP